MMVSGLSPSHVTQLLAAAAGAGAGAARRCLEAALWGSGAVSVHVDGFDELCPAFKSKMLRLLEMLLRDTKAALVWVSSRPEIETSLHATLRCPSVSLTSITREEQHHYLYTRWAFESQFNILSAKQSADKVITAMARHAPEDKSTSELLAAPLHLEMVAEIFAKAQPASLEGDLNLNVCELYQKFVELKEDDYLKKHGLGDANLENFPCYDDDYFSRLHKNCAMFLLVADKEFKGIDIKPFENFINKKQQALLKAKTGIMWMDEDLSVHFVHYSFVEFFAASWLNDNITSEPARAVVRSLYESEGSDNMSTFLNWMLTEGCLLHRALLSSDRAALERVLDVGEEPVDRRDGVGRTALHVSVALRDEQSSALLLRKQCNVDLRDALFDFTPLQFADQYFRPSTRAGAFMMDAVLRTMERLLVAGAQHCRLQWFAADMRNAIDEIDDGYQEVMKLLMEHGMTEYDYIYALHRAESKFQSKIVHILLTHPLSQCSKEAFGIVSSGMTSLEQSEQLRISRQLFEEHRKHHKTEHCNVPLHCLAYEGNAKSLQKELTSPEIDHRNLMFGMTPLHIAVHKRQVECAEFLTDYDHFVNQTDTDRFTPLHCAVEIGHVEMVQLLLKKGARVELGAESGLTPLHLAVLLDRIPCLVPLHEYSSDPNLTDDYGFTPLLIATAMGRLTVTEKLLTMGADPNLKSSRETSPLHFIAERNDEPAAKCLLQHRANPHETNMTGRKPVHIAANHGSLNVIKTLQTFGAEINSLSRDGKTPLHYACFGGQQECVGYLLENGVNVDHRDTHGRSALHCAAYRGHEQVVRTLLTAGAVVNQTTDFGSSPLTLAAYNGHLSCVKCLLQHDAEVNGSNSGGYAALHGAAEKGHLSVMETLLEAGANANDKPDMGTHNTLGKPVGLTSLFHFRSYSRDSDEARKRREELESLVEPGESEDHTSNSGGAPLTLAACNGHRLCVDCLLLRGAEVDLRDGEGFTPLHRACQEGHLHVAKALVKAGASVNAMCGDGTPVSLAASRRNWDCVDFLLTSGAVTGDAYSNGLTLLHIAAKHGQLQVVNRILEMGPIETTDEEQPTVSGGVADWESIHPQSGKELNKPDENGWTPLHHAAEKGYVTVVEKLVAAGADVNAKSNEGRTPLILAAQYGQWSCVSALLENGAEVNDSDAEGLPPLHRAVKCKHLALVNSLLNAGAVVNAKTDSGDTPLGLAVANGHLECIDALLARGADQSHADPDGFTLLHCAVKTGQPNIVKRLLAAEADVDPAANDGRTPLVVAAMAGEWACVEVLVQHGARVNACDSLGFTALHAAAETSNAYRVVEQLTAAGASVNTATNTGRTPLMLAVETGRADCVKYLLRCGADVNMADDCRETALHFAAARGRVDALQWILDAGGVVNAKSDDGNTPLTCAASERQWECVEVLLRSGGDVNEANDNGNTALHYAAKAGNFKAVEALLKAGASVHATNASGKTPLMLAMLYGTSKCVDCLLQAEEM